MMASNYNVADVFYTIQGEGPHCGRPAIFIRFSGCNLRCQWGKNRCDTPYTSWQAERNWVTFKALTDQIQALREANGCSYLVLTGGEPTLQRLTPLCEHLKKEGFTIAIETNGTLKLPEDEIDFAICSPKLSDSVPPNEPERSMHEASRLKAKDYIKSLVDRGAKNVFLKFVVGTETSIDEIESFVMETGMPKDNVYLMPEGLTQGEILDNQVKVSEWAKTLGYQFTTRLHILLWGNTRAT